MLPTFATPRLLLRPRTLADTDVCLAMDRDPEVTRFISGPWADPPAHRAFVEARTRGPYPAGLGYWTIRRTDDPAPFLGWVLLIPVDGKGPEIEIGWRLVRVAWGLGFATEAAGRVLRHAFVTVRLPEVIAPIDPENVRSQRVAEKLGLMRSESAPRQDDPTLHYALKREEFVA
jgi:RimJ/RimL family protein N-acetyltransferase